MTFLTPIILGVLIFSTAAGITYLGLSIYSMFFAKNLDNYHSTLYRETYYNVFKVATILAVILAVLELFL